MAQSNLFFFLLPAIDNSQLVHVSRQYRSIIRDCQEQLDRLAEDEADRMSQDAGADPQAHIQQSELLYKLELIWNLVEVLMIEKTASEFHLAGKFKKRGPKI